MLFSPFRHFNGKVTIHLIVQRSHFWLRIHVRYNSHMENCIILAEIRQFSGLIHCIDCVHPKIFRRLHQPLFYVSANKTVGTCYKIFLYTYFEFVLNLYESQFSEGKLKMDIAVS